jgi:hypothetical protein
MFDIPRVLIRSAARPALAIIAGLSGIVTGQNPPPTQLFYVPFPEDQQLAAFDAINPVANNPITVFVTFAAATDGTVIYYDHWEDGYEKDITNPVQPTTLVFGDGNPANGYPPGNAADLIPAGTVFNLRNFVDTATLGAVLDFDARDKIASFKPISVTKTSFPDGTDTLLAGCVEVFERGLWGTEYRSPIGVDMPTTATPGALAHDENLFSYAALSISAGPGGANVQVDKDNNGVFEETVALAEGESFYRDGVNAGGRVLADKPVQVVLFTGTVGSTYASRDTNLLPVNRWSSDYFAPVSTPLGNGTVTFLYNPGSSPITVYYDYRNSLTTYATANVTVPAGGNARVTMSPASGTTHYGAYRFYTIGAMPPLFYAMSVIDADEAAAGGNNQNWDGGFTLVGRPSLTTQVLLSLGIGRDPYSATNPNENGNPLWITTSGNGHSPERVYVDYDGDNAGPLADPNGNRYDVHFDLRELQQQKIFDPDGDQSGMLVYTLNPAVRIAAAWGQDPTVASIAQPGLDVASLVPPLREGEAGKKSNLVGDADGDGFVSAGDMLEYDIRAVSNARTSIPGPFAVQDHLPGDVNYVAGSTRYRFMIGGAWQAWTAIPDDGSGTPFPLDGSGFSIPGTLGSSQQFQVTFRAVIKDPHELSGGPIENTGTVEISPYGLLLPIGWSDVVYGSIGDRVWNDLNGDGVQDPGEAGIPGVRMFADANGNGILDAGERWDTTGTDGEYLLAGLVAGSYQVRVDPADIAAANVGYGPTFDLDGLATLHSASVELGAAEDRTDADFGYRVGASVGDRVWMDRDGDGVQEAGEPGINGIRVYLDLDQDNSYDVGEPFAMTSGDGAYYIGNLAAGTYVVRIDTASLPVGANATFDLDGGLDHEASVTLLAAEHRGDLDFGYRGSLSIGDLVWQDVNGNGNNSPAVSTFNVSNGRMDFNRNGSYNSADNGYIGGLRIIGGYADLNGDGQITSDGLDTGSYPGLSRGIVNGGFDINNSGTITNTDDGTVTYTAAEAGIPNVRVYIDSNGNGAFDPQEPSALTNGSGIYGIGNLFNGSYTVRVDPSTLPPDVVQTYDLTSPWTDNTAVVVLNGANNNTVDFGYRSDGRIGDLVWNDRNANGVRDPGEAGIEGVLVYIDADGDNAFDQGVERYAITGVDGHYEINNLPPGLYSVRVEISTLPQGSTATFDLDGTGSPHEAFRPLGQSENAVDVDFGYRGGASFGDRVWADLDFDGIQDPGESGIPGVTVYADINGDGSFNAAEEPSAVTDGSGAYTIGNLVPGTYTARVVPSTLPAGLVQTYDLNGPVDHAATFSLSASEARIDVDFGYTARATLGDFVWHDTNANGQQDGGEPGIGGVEVTVYNAVNDTVAGTAVTDSNGFYAFGELLPGTYYVVFEAPSGHLPTRADQGADASDSDAHPVTGRTANVTLTGGQTVLTLDAGFYLPGAIRGAVWVDENGDDSGDSPLAGVLLTLLGADGEPYDSDPDSPGVQTVTTSTAMDGSYAFTGLPPGIYGVAESHPAGYYSLGDKDGGDPDLIHPLTVVAGETNDGNDFIEILDTCADTWAEWLALHPGENAAGNPDGDVLDNFGEFAFAQAHDSGAGSPFCIAVSAGGDLTGTFIRPKQATDHVTYVLEFAAALGNPTVWQSIVLQPSHLAVSDNGYCREDVTILDLEEMTGLEAGSGFVRLRADLDANQDLTVDHVAWTPVKGWKETTTSPGCRSFNNPFLHCPVFTGTVTSAGGSVIDLSGSAGGGDIGFLLASGASYYAEITSGENEGHRFDLVAAAGGLVTVAVDDAPASLTPPFNTMTGTLPADLAGDGIVIRRHWTLTEVFPPANFAATGSQSTADQIQIGSAGQWTLYWLYDDAGTPRWVNDVSLADRGDTVLPPGQGIFLNKRGTTGVILAHGEVRANDFMRPLSAGANLVGGGYPLDQSATGPGGRSMTPAQGFSGSRNFKQADRFLIWNGDAAVPAAGYASYFLLDGTPVQPGLVHWARVGDVNFLPQGDAPLFPGHRSAFVEVAADRHSYLTPSPWTP